MGQTLFYKIVAAHLLDGKLVPGEEVAIRVDQTLTQDSLGTMAYLQFEAMGRERVATELSVAYTDHLMLQLGEGNADSHRYLETVADRCGAIYSKAGNGICHQVHLERFARPGRTLIGGDSHTVTCGAMGMAALGAGGLDVALAMGGMPFYITCPEVVRVVLRGRLPPWSTAKDIALEVLRQLGTEGNVGTVLEYGGDGLAGLSVPERATIANMGAETGVTTSIFPSDAVTRSFLEAQGREGDYLLLQADDDAAYAQTVVIDLGEMQPLVALPHAPDNVRPVADCSPTPVHQVLIGSCTNASYRDMKRVAAILRGRKIHPEVSLGIAPGSRQVMAMLAREGALADMIEAGARILESGCGFCVGQGQAPELGAVSVRTSNRNYRGRSGTQDAQVYLVSPETAAATALAGALTDPRALGDYPDVPPPRRFHLDDSMLLFPTGTKTIYRSHLIGQPPVNTPMPDTLRGRVAIKVGDNINTDDIIPGGAAMTYRANVQRSCDFIFQFIDGDFPTRCRALVAEGLSPVIVAGAGYGQGSSREHAALCPMVMGVRCVLAKSFERIHGANLINFGILPLVFRDPGDYDHIRPGDTLHLDAPRDAVLKDAVTVANETRGVRYTLLNTATPRQREIVRWGGRLNTL